MKKLLRISLILFLLVLSTICIFIVDKDGKNNVSLAQATSSSDIQLMQSYKWRSKRRTIRGQVAVGAVILNRVKDSRFPNSISGVIYQAGAFTAVSDGQINVAIKEDSTVYKAARDAMNGWDLLGVVCIILIQILQQINGYGLDH